jgi:2-oxoisovalerate ferredoxin oxidoreductase beta subunit
MPNNNDNGLFTITHEKASCFYPHYERKGELPDQTHYCPGCGHGIVHKLLAECIDELGIQDRVILISPVGCSVFAYYYFDVGNVQVAHGRAPAVATAVKRAHPNSIVISYQGDGDLAAIGAAEILHAANRGENITVLFVNNAIYGMTGGQMAPTSLPGQKTTTSPTGRDSQHDGYPMRVSELLASLEGPTYLERVSLGDVKRILQAKKAIRRALECQMSGLGFSLVELLSPCPTIWKLDPVDAQKQVHEVMEKFYVPGITCDRRAARTAFATTPAPPPLTLDQLPQLLDLPLAHSATRNATHPTAQPLDWRIRIAGFGGQGVLLMGQLLAEAAMDDGLEVSWLPSYGPEMRSGTSNCHVRISSRPIDSPLVAHANALLALNEPSLRKFLPAVEPGGLVLYNGDAVPADCQTPGINIYALPFAEIANQLGSAKVGNMVMLGAFLALSHFLPDERMEAALTRLVSSERWIEIDRKALAVGRERVPAEEFRHV